MGWETEEEEDIWDIDLDFGGSDSEEGEGLGSEMTIAQMMEIRFIKAEREKEFVSNLLSSLNNYNYSHS